jgi:nucleotide-binding universal stress UspA family protein
MNQTPSIHSMLVALDESPRAPLVFATAALMAQHLGAQVHLIRVLTPPPDVPPSAHRATDVVEGLLERSARDELGALMQSEPMVPFGPPVIVEGDPWRRILEVSRDLDVDLIVMGSHRFHGLERVLGTVAARVVNHADRNVLVVHERRPVTGRRDQPEG